VDTQTFRNPSKDDQYNNQQIGEACSFKRINLGFYPRKSLRPKKLQVLLTLHNEQEKAGTITNSSDIHHE
jgi:hypothetical protein